eukprot:TRINITY_DN34556_c0_g3_i1.p1 TRINITY_DN34556_c0_g3~~TRINITY_DN34556_c0_g3_i1.p1  ORF type:complete len:522 (-),score=125.55 TRINITY_DN34556_c0_g3_i1:41-1606(-)
MGNNASLKKKLTVKEAPKDEPPQAPQENPTQVPSGPDETSEDDVRPAIWDKYKLGKTLGKGTFGEVRKASLLSDKKVVRAVKMVQSRDEKTFDREVDILREISHRNIVSFHDVYKTGSMCFMVIELCKGGELFEHIIKRKAYYESDAASAAADMLSAINYLHGVSIMHRDIKAENFLLSEATEKATIKLIDFGFARRFLEGQHFKEICGSPFSLAPELLNKHYTHLVDMWAFGVVMYLMMCGDYPYKGDSVKEMKRVLAQPLSLKESLSPEGQAFIRGLLQVDIASRLTAREALKHPFMGLSQQIHVRLSDAVQAAPQAPLACPRLLTPQEPGMLLLPRPSLRSVHSTASVNSNIHAAVQSAQLEIEVQKGQKDILADADDASEAEEVKRAMKSGSTTGNEELPEPLSPVSTNSKLHPLPVQQIQERKRKVAAAIHNAGAALTGGVRAHMVSAGSSSPGTKQKDKELPQLTSLVPAQCDSAADDPQRLRPTYKTSLPALHLPGQLNASAESGTPGNTERDR